MKMDHDFEPERALAQHCDELTSVRIEAEQCGEQMESWAKAMRAAWDEQLASLFYGEKMRVTGGEASLVEAEKISEKIGPLAANYILGCTRHNLRVLFSLDLKTAVALTDRGFGGIGEVENEECQALPRSAAIVIERLAKLLAAAISQHGDGSDEAEIVCRHENIARLDPFASANECALMEFAIEQDDGKSWAFVIAMRAEDLRLLANDSAPCAPDSQAPSATVPLGAIPMPLSAALAKITLPMSRLEHLQPGDTIPLTMGREIPLACGSQTIARGIVGTLDDRIALQITSILHEGH